MGGSFGRANHTRSKKNPTLIRGVLLFQSPVTRRYHLPAKVGEPIVKELTCSSGTRPRGEPLLKRVLALV
jgi:hypothetical protein